MRRSNVRWGGPAALLGVGLALSVITGIAAFGLWLALEAAGGSFTGSVIDQIERVIGIDTPAGGSGSAPWWLVALFVIAICACAFSVLIAIVGLCWLVALSWGAADGSRRASDLGHRAADGSRTWTQRIRERFRRRG